MKTCRKCGALFDTADCGECNKARCAKYRLEHIEREKEHHRKWYAANKEKDKATFEKWRAENHKKLLARKAKYREKNAKQVKAARDKFYAAHKEQLKVDSARWYANNADKAKITNQRWYANNADKAKITNQKWRAENPERVRVNKKLYANTRRARKMESGGVLSKGLLEKLVALQKGKCACCRQPLGKSYHMDHIIPLARGGTNEDRNIQLLRAKCNRQKGTKHPIAFMQQRGFLI